jgi:hypothetical protein
MKNIQVIDGAINCIYEIFAATDEQFAEIFADGTDIEFVEDFFERLGEERATQVITPLWTRPLNKKSVVGIHGTLFYQLKEKAEFYPTKKEAEFVAWGQSPLTPDDVPNDSQRPDPNDQRPDPG